MTNAEKIKSGLKKKEMTQKDLAKIIEVSPIYVSLIASGKRKGTNYLAKIEEILNIKLTH